jgi:hypothetical protein
MFGNFGDNNCLFLILLIIIIACCCNGFDRKSC